MATTGIALWTYLIPMFRARALRMLILAVIVFVGLILLGLGLGRIDRDTVAYLRELAVVPGVPVAAILMGEMPLRDGIRQRTLLYPLQGPSSRMTLAIVRTLVTALVLAIGACLLTLLLGAIADTRFSELIETMGAIVLGSFAYISFFGLIHLITRRGLIAGVAIYLADELLGRAPLALRKLAPNVHFRELADMVETFRVPIRLGSHEPSVVLSVFVLLILGIAALAGVSILFSRRNLGELC